MERKNSESNNLKSSTTKTDQNNKISSSVNEKQKNNDEEINIEEIQKKLEEQGEANNNDNEHFSHNLDGMLESIACLIASEK